MRSPYQDRSQRAALLCGVVTAALGLVGIFTWSETTPSSYIAMAPGSSLGFLLLGGALLVHTKRPSWTLGSVAVTLAALLVSLPGALKFIELDLDISMPLLSTTYGVLPPVSPITSANFLFASLTTFALLIPHRFTQQLVSPLASLGVLVNTIVLLGYVYGTPVLYGQTIYPVSPVAAMAFVTLAAGLVAAAGPSYLPLRAFAGDSSKAILLRAFVPLTAVGVLAGGIINKTMLEHFQLNPALSAALTALLVAALVTLVVSQTARWIGEAMDRAEAGRRRAEDERRESQRKLATLMSNLPGIAYRCRNDRDWTMEFVSEGSAELLGYRPSDVIEGGAVSFAELIHPDDRERVWAEVQRCLDAKQPYQLEYRIRTAGGREKWVWEQGRGITDTAGPVVALEGFITDISDRKRAEQESRDAHRTLESRVEERTMELSSLNDSLQGEIAERTRLRDELERFFTLSLDLLCIAGADGYFKRLNPAWQETLGYSVDELLSKPYFDLVHPEDRDATVAEAKKLAEGALVISFENRYLCKDGSYRWLLWKSAPTPDGRLVYAAARDITPRKLAEQELERSVSLLEATLEAAADGIVAIDQDEKISHWNQMFTDMWRVPEGILKDRDAKHLFRHTLDLLEDPGAFVKAVEESQSEPVGERYDVLQLKDGRTIERRSRAQIIGGKAVGRVVTFRDITERTNAERMKEEFVSIVSHELRTPLTSLRGFAELLLTRKFPKRKQQEFFEIIRDESVRLTDLINDFLDIRRMESGQQVYHFEPMQLAPLLNDVRAVFADGNPKHRLTLEVPEDLPKISADSKRLRQALSNLISNAIKFSPRGGDVIVRVKVQRGEVVCSVSDEGIGIPAAIIPKLFTKFFRADNEETREIGGTGLGLALVRAAAEAHGGRVWVTSDPGRGSTFFLTLPLVPEETAVPPLRPRDGGTTDVLVVEDDTTYSRLLAEHLQDAGLSVVTTRYAEQAMTLLLQALPRVVLTDLQLAGPMDGWDLLIAVKKNPSFRTAPILVISATETRLRGLALDGAEYILKPAPPQALLKAIRRYIPRLRGKRVLVADDDPRFRAEIAELLGDKGVQVEQASNGQTALTQLDQRPPDLLILDLLMPEVDGFGVLRKLRQDRKAVNLPVIVTTGIDLLPAEQAYIKKRLASLVSKKDASPEHIVRVVEQLVNEPRDDEAPVDAARLAHRYMG